MLTCTGIWHRNDNGQFRKGSTIVFSSRFTLVWGILEKEVTQPLKTNLRTASPKSTWNELAVRPISWRGCMMIRDSRLVRTELGTSKHKLVRVSLCMCQIGDNVPHAKIERSLKPNTIKRKSCLFTHNFLRQKKQSKFPSLSIRESW